MRTYGKVLVKEGKWRFVELEPHVAIKLKQIFPRIPKSASAPDITIDDTPENGRELDWFLLRYPLQLTADDLSHLTAQKSKHVKKLEDLEAFLAPDYTPRQLPLKIPLRAYQAQAVDIYLRNKVLLNGDAIGLGKTAQAIGSLTEPSTLPALIVVQTHLPKQWQFEVERFSDLKVHLINGTKPYNLPPADVYIMKYSCLAGWVDTFQTGIFKSVIYDEVQELRRSESAKYQAAKTLSKSVQYALGLSATPIYNFGDEIYNILHMLKEDCLGAWSDFSREWCGFNNTIKNPKALGTYLRENFLFLRRTREDVGRALPPVNKIVYTVDYDEEAVSSVEDTARALAIRATTGTFIERGQAARELDIMIRHMTGVSKAKSVAAYVRVLLESGEPILLAGWHRDVYDIWLEALKDYNPVMYTGSESPAEKERAKQDFIEGKSNLMIISLRSGIGLNGLQHRSSVVVFGELDWSPQIHNQVIGRLDREGQETPVTAIYLVSESGSDPLMVNLNGLKASEAHSIIDPNESLATSHSDESRIRMLAELVLKKKPLTEGPSHQA